MSIEVPIIILIFIAIFYFLIKWILNIRNWGNIKNRKILALISAVILAPISYVAIIMIWIFSITFYISDNFNKEEWKHNEYERYRMTEDIIENQILLGKTKNEIIELLGNDYNICNENEITYFIGHVPGLFNIDPSVLAIYFNNGKVVKVTQYET